MMLPAAALVESHLSEDKERRASAIRAFIADQYASDQEVRFKQIDLQNRLLDLFVDVPVPLLAWHQPVSASQQKLIFAMHSIVRGDEDSWQEDRSDPVDATYGVVVPDYPPFGTAQASIGAATMLLHPVIQSNAPRIVLEGAPGQGKSTIAQYVCQVHRMRLLGKQDSIAEIPQQHRSSPVRVPFKVDLRDLATWLGGKDPFSSADHGAPPANWRKSLEAFLAAQVKHHSGGIDFSVGDLHAVAKFSAFLLVLDGLDEVAEIPKRKEVVDEAIAGINRLKESAVSLQVVITSRPAAFTNSPGFPEDIFPNCQLSSLSRRLIDDYTTRWLMARHLPKREKDEIKRILKTKLDQPHLRDLARNPMQLAILLTLIHTRGSSLPDKRTALYDSYVELFFNREAEKSSIVREHRDLLVDIHRYLAWVLHSEAEEKDSRGSIATDRLRRLLAEYLSNEGRNSSLADDLFAGMVERVVALVSRVQGTFEFEVQPLREYFAARWLYDTAPYSPPGRERKGTKPERFDVIAQNFYWLNVTRFFAGCFSKGELSGLVDRMQVLAQKDGFRNTSHPRILAALLLSDWVFAQHQRSLQEVVALVLDGMGLRYVLPSVGRRRGAGVQLVLPKDSGKDELLERCFAILNEHPVMDYALEVVDLIRANASSEEIKSLWDSAIAGSSGAERTKWLQYGLNLGLVSELSKEELETLLADGPHDRQRMNILFRSKQVSFCESSEARCDVIIRSILDRDTVTGKTMAVPSVLGFFAQILDPDGYALAFEFPRPIALADIWKEHPMYVGRLATQASISERSLYPSLEKCVEVISVAERQHFCTAKEWASELGPWDNIVEESRRVWGEQWAHFHLANIASGIRSSTETCKDFPDLMDHSRSLCRRARYARLRAGMPDWWKKQLVVVSSELAELPQFG